MLQNLLRKQVSQQIGFFDCHRSLRHPIWASIWSHTGILLSEQGPSFGCVQIHGAKPPYFYPDGEYYHYQGPLPYELMQALHLTSRPLSCMNHSLAGERGKLSGVAALAVLGASFTEDQLWKLVPVLTCKDRTCMGVRIALLGCQLLPVVCLRWEVAVPQPCCCPIAHSVVQHRCAALDARAVATCIGASHVHLMRVLVSACRSCAFE